MAGYHSRFSSSKSIRSKEKRGDGEGKGNGWKKVAFGFEKTQSANKPQTAKIHALPCPRENVAILYAVNCMRTETHKIRYDTCCLNSPKRKTMKKNWMNVTLTRLPFAHSSVHWHIANAMSKAALGGLGRDKTVTLGDPEPFGQRAEPREQGKVSPHACASPKSFLLEGGGEGQGTETR